MFALYEDGGKFHAGRVMSETDASVQIDLQYESGTDRLSKVVLPTGDGEITYAYDSAGRLQTVSRDTNPRYHRLIEAFRELTGVPMVLNTSFNENEPVVCRPEEALDCFLRTRMDVLVMGEWVVERKTQD